MKTYKVSIALLTHNRVAQFEKALKSLLNQTFHDFEIIISDDNSTDGTNLLVQHYLNKYTNIRYVRHSGIGMTANFLASLRASSSEYFMWLCDDDFISENYIEKCYEFLETNFLYSFVCGKTHFFNQNGILDTHDYFCLEDDKPQVRVLRYFRNVNNNIYLYGLMRKKQIETLVYPNVFGADLFWSSQLAYAGKMKILDNCLFYYSKDGISSDLYKLSNYYSNTSKYFNPYMSLSSNFSDLVLFKSSVFSKLNYLQKKLLQVNVYLIIRERFCKSKVENRIRGILKIRTRIKHTFIKCKRYF